MLSDICDGGEELCVALSGVRGGVLILEGCKYPILDGGRATLAFPLPDGAYAPQLLLEGKRISLMPFAIRNGKAVRFPEDNAYLTSLCALMMRTMDATEALDLRIAELEKKMNGVPLFNFHNEKGEI